MKHLPVRLTADARRVVAKTIEAHCAYRGWELAAVNVRSNHLHVVVGQAGVAPEVMMRELKAWCTRRLREAGLVGAEGAVWTAHGSTRYLWKENAVATAVDYVVEGQEPERFEGRRSELSSE